MWECEELKQLSHKITFSHSHKSTLYNHNKVKRQDKLRLYDNDDDDDYEGTSVSTLQALHRENNYCPLTPLANEASDNFP